MCLNQPESKIVHHEIGPLCQKVWGPLIQTIDINDVENRKKKKGENKRQGSLSFNHLVQSFFSMWFSSASLWCMLSNRLCHPSEYVFLLFIYRYIDIDIYRQTDIYRYRYIERYIMDRGAWQSTVHMVAKRWP